MSQTTLDFSAYIADRTQDLVGHKWVFAGTDQWLGTFKACTTLSSLESGIKHRGR